MNLGRVEILLNLAKLLNSLFRESFKDNLSLFGSPLNDHNCLVLIDLLKGDFRLLFCHRSIHPVFVIGKYSEKINVVDRLFVTAV